MTEIKTNTIPHRLKTVNKEHPYVGGAVDIYDDILEKPQSEVNQDMIQETGTLDGKIATEKERAEGVEAGLRESIDELGTIHQHFAQHPTKQDSQSHWSQQ